MFGGQHFDGAALHVAHGADFERVEGDERRFGRGQAREVGPDEVVEDVLAQRGQGVRQGVHAQRLAGTGGGDGVDHQRQAGDVVEVRVGEEDVVDAQHLLAREVADAGAGVDEHVLIDQERRCLAIASDGAGAAEHTHPHVQLPALLFGVEVRGAVPAGAGRCLKL